MGEKGDTIAVLINVKDRPTELALLLQSLRTQTYKNFDIFILDDCSGTLLNTYHFMNCLITRIKLEGHLIYMERTPHPHGVSNARQKIVDIARKKGYKWLLRVDDDVILEEDYIQKLREVIKEGYDLASGVTAPMAGPSFVRETTYLNGIVNRVILDDEGEYIMNGDDCGIQYLNDEILPAHHFRSCALYKAEIHDKVNYTPTKLSMHGFREEQLLSYKMQMAGYKLGVHTGAMAWHQITPSGGERFAQSQEMIQHNQQVLVDFTKEHKEELNKLFPKEPMPTKQQLMKETNLLMK